ncbi:MULTISPECIES: N-methyl-L-tryptophan oxidase [Oceanimonas]|uniref:N-methyltryptophan oxidase n=1 Tax=Oceanimonas doudoroffii TaxID=84158 RepID=A0A233RHC9_9GAMM|nr:MULTISPECIES: N-methyl-L-tryptophan oxidase [Oceanimonas]NHI00615.1 Monomeric sarcosine oxidase [Oceanimonas sp. MB9]OXY82789.1 N-methyltryptophan oxidase [Oceanimonas doudoroffii]
MDADILIIGAGSVGMAAGYYAACQGARVLLLDEGHPPHTLGSHHGSTRLTRTAYGEGEAYIPLLLRARALWTELEQLSGERLFEPCGVLNLGVADSPFLAQVRRSAAEYGLALEQESAAGIEARWPGWGLPAGFSGGYEPEAGVLYCERALSAWHRLGSAQGARLLGGRTVTGLKAIPGGMGVELADGERFTAAQVLVCAGQRVAPLMAQLGLHLPLQRVRKTFAWYRADVMRYGPAAFPGFSADLANAVYYGFPTLNGEGFKIGRHDAGQPLEPGEPLASFGSFSQDRAELDAFVHDYLPGVGEFIEGKVCHYIRTPDEHFILDRHPEHEGVFFASACSGHGFKFAAVLGETFARWMLDGEPGFDLGSFALSRFGR